jgi:prophage antirepressor-like protein
MECRRRGCMNNMPTIFNFEDRKVRVVIVNNEPWFVAKDVCEVLEISKHRDAVSRLDDDERGSVLVDTPGGKQEMTAVNEYGIYSLVMTSRKPEAKKFKRWVTHEVLPAIRKTGSYSVQQNNVVPLSKDQAIVTVLRTTADLLEGQEELRQGQQ